MFLTKKGLIKILVMAISYFTLGSLLILLSFHLSENGSPDRLLLILGIVMYPLCVLFVFWGRYAEGKGKLVSLGYRLLRRDLKPAEFIRRYETLKNADNLIVKKPSVEVLQLVAIAYNALDDAENALAAANEMIGVAGAKKKTFANLFKAALLFSYGDFDEAEALFNENRKDKPDIVSAALADGILKDDRAWAMGDCKTVEAYNLSLLNRTFPKLDNLTRLIANYRLGEVYEKLNETEKAVSYYKYCAAYGGETAIKASAEAKLEQMG